MTVPAASRIQTYPLVTGTGPFGYSFPVVTTNALVPYIKVTKVSADGATRTPLVYPGDYTFTLVQNGQGGGTITPAVALSNETLVIEGDTPVTQDVAYRNESDFFPEKHEKSYDKLTLIQQEKASSLSRSLKLVPETSFVGDFLMDTPTAGSVLVIDGTAKRIIMGPTVTDVANAASNATLAKDWATKIVGTVDGSEYSSKEYAIGTQRRGLAGGGSAMDWATYMAGTVDNTLYSSRYYADQANVYAQQAMAAANGMKYRSVRCATTANITLSAPQTIDGVSAIAGDRVLAKNQSTASQNGIYVVADGAWTRASDMDTWAEVPGTVVVIEEGTTLADTAWICTANQGGTLGTTSITFASWANTIIDGTLSLTKIAAIAANTIMMNATAGSASPSAVSFAANTFPARGSTGNLAAKVISDDALAFLAAANNEAMRTALGAPGLTQSDWFAYCPGSVENGTQYIILTPGYAMTITSVSYYCASGSVSATVVNDSVGNIFSGLTINGTPGVNNSPSNATIGSSGAMYITFSSASSPKFLNMTFRFTRSLV